MGFAAVFRALVWRYARHEWFRTLLTISGVALGVAVLVAVDLASGTSVASFKNTIRDVAGSAQLTVRANGAGLPPSLVGKLSSNLTVAGLSPMISGEAVYTTEAGNRQPMLVLGVDLLRTQETPGNEVRGLNLELADGISISDLLVDPNALVFTGRFIREQHLERGQRIALDIAGVRRDALIAASVDGGTLADVQDGRVIIADLGVADVLLRRNGLLDRIDITLAEGTSPTVAIGQLQEMLPPTAVLETPERRGSQVDDMIAGFRFNLRALGYVSVLVGAFLIYNTMNIAVVRRRRAVGTVRAMGVRRRQIRAAFLLEGGLIGAVGSLAGIVLGTAMAQLLLGVMSEAISINFFATNPGRLLFSAPVYTQSFLLGMCTSIVAAFGPANEAAITPPANTMREGTQNAARGGETLLIAAAAVLLVLSVVALRLPVVRGIPVGGYGCALLVLAAFVMLSRPLLRLIAWSLRVPFARTFGAPGLIAISSTQASLGRAGVAVAGLLVSLAMAVSITIMIGSFRTTVIAWMEQVLVADIYISPSVRDATARPEPFPDDIAAKISTIPGVAGVDPFRLQPIVYEGAPALFGAGALSVVRFTSKTLDGRPMREALQRAKREGGAIISEAFARRHKLRAGDVVTLPSPAGPLHLPVAGVYHDYSSEQGFVIMDRDLYKKVFSDHRIDSIAVYLDADADRQKVSAEIRRIIAADTALPALSLQANTDLKSFALKAFDRTFAVTYVLQTIAVLVAVLGVAATLLAQILDRRQEIRTMRFMGAGRSSVARVVILESSLMALAGSILGAVAGILLSIILTRVIMRDSFGWTIEFHVQPMAIIRITAIIFAATIASAILPARNATRLSIN